MSDRPLPPGSTIGILGGGQLGRMTAMAAARLGYRCLIFSPEEHAVAADVAAGHVRGDYPDTAALARFASQVDVVTYEFENIPEAAVVECQRHRPVRPGVQPLHTAQHRLREKAFFRKFGLATADYQSIASDADIAGATALPGILKTCTDGYDGKGQVRVADRATLKAGWETLGRRECILEGLVDFACEISVIAARGPDGTTRCFPIGRNEHRDGILRTTHVPSGLPADTQATAERYGRDLADGLEVAGRSDGEASLDHVHAQAHQGLGHLHFFGQVHARARRLLAVAERGVEDHNASRFICGTWSGHGICLSRA